MSAARSITMRAIGDCAVVEIVEHEPGGEGVVKLCSRHDVVRAWPGARVAASLADPPRLALRLSGGSVVVVDPSTGDIARAVDEALGIAWFSPKNGLLCGFDARGLVRVEAREKRVRRRGRPPNADPRATIADSIAQRERGAAARTAPPIVDVCVSPSGKLLLGRVAFVPGNVVACVDAVHDRLQWSRDVSAGAPVVLGVARGYAVIAAINVEGVTIEMRDLATGMPRETPLRLSRIREEPDSFRAIFARAFSSEVVVAVMRKGGQVSRHVLDLFERNQWRTTADDRVGVDGGDDVSRPGPLLFARLDTAQGSVIVDATRASTSCFTPRGVAIVIANGVAHTIESGAPSSLHAIAGPTNLVAVAPHPSGVVVLDGDDRAHVLVIDDDGARERIGPEAARDGSGGKYGNNDGVDSDEGDGDDGGDSGGDDESDESDASDGSDGNGGIHLGDGDGNGEDEVEP